jgi:hypothetical protein
MKVMVSDLSLSLICTQVPRHTYSVPVMDACTNGRKKEAAQL